MSNILIIKHGSLGDLIQANGAIKDIKKTFPDKKVLLLTTPSYANFMTSCPYVDGVFQCFCLRVFPFSLFDIFSIIFRLFFDYFSIFSGKCLKSPFPFIGAVTRYIRQVSDT